LVFLFRPILIVASLFAAFPAAKPKREAPFKKPEKQAVIKITGIKIKHKNNK
jgi:hypothetical protein